MCIQSQIYNLILQTASKKLQVDVSHLIELSSFLMELIIGMGKIPVLMTDKPLCHQNGCVQVKID